MSWEKLYTLQERYNMLLHAKYRYEFNLLDSDTALRMLGLKEWTPESAKLQRHGTTVLHLAARNIFKERGWESNLVRLLRSTEIPHAVDCDGRTPFQVYIVSAWGKGIKEEMWRELNLEIMHWVTSVQAAGTDVGRYADAERTHWSSNHFTYFSKVNTNRPDTFASYLATELLCSSSSQNWDIAVNAHIDRYEPLHNSLPGRWIDPTQARLPQVLLWKPCLDELDQGFWQRKRRTNSLFPRTISARAEEEERQATITRPVLEALSRQQDDHDMIACRLSRSHERQL